VIFIQALAKNGSFASLGCGLDCVACKCAVCGSAKIELKKMCGGENKKYRRVGNECRLTRCPFEICSVCWSLVKMVYFLVFNRQFDVVVSVFTLAGNISFTQYTQVFCEATIFLNTCKSIV
jgi:hypothetical protein